MKIVQDINNGASSQVSTQVDKISKKHHSQKANQRSSQKTNSKNKPGYINSCKYCALAHPRGKCPAHNQICKGCGKKNHFKAVCKAKHVKQIVAESSCDSESDDEAEFFVGSITSCTTGDDNFDVTASLKQLEILSEEIAEYQNELENMDTLNKVNPEDIRTGESFTGVYNDKGESVSGEKNEHSDKNLSNDNNLSSQSSDSDSDDIEEYFIDAVDFVENDSTHQDWIATLKTCGTDVEYKLDWGAQVNILPEHIYKELRVRPKLHRTRVKLTSYSGDCIPVKGKVIGRVEKGQNRSYPVQFFCSSCQISSYHWIKHMCKATID